VVGVAGLELLGDSALLRSVAVAEPHRDHGTGKELFRVVSAKARAQKVRKLYLLTTTAAAYFERLGFSRLERSAAPAEVRATREYSQLCPDSSQLMVKDL
jgi:amino-acid N-acetyltransferase